MYDERLADRIRDALGAQATGDERRMFGGLGFMVGGHLAVCAGHDGGLLVRTTGVDTHVRDDGSGPVTAMEMNGRRSATWLRVAPEACADDVSLRRWVLIGAAVAGSMPPSAEPATPDVGETADVDVDAPDVAADLGLEPHPADEPVA